MVSGAYEYCLTAACHLVVYKGDTLVPSETVSNKNRDYNKAHHKCEVQMWLLCMNTDEGELRRTLQSLSLGKQGTGGRVLIKTPKVCGNNTYQLLYVIYYNYYAHLWYIKYAYHAPYAAVCA